MNPRPISLLELRTEIDLALDALGGGWRGPSDGRIKLVLGSREARNAVIRDLRRQPPTGTYVEFLAADGLFLSLLTLAQHVGINLDVYGAEASLRALAVRFATAGQRLVLICDDVEHAAPHDLGYLCRGVSATHNDVRDGKPGILLILMGTEGAAHRRVGEAWDHFTGIISHDLA